MRNYDADVAAELAKEILNFYCLIEFQAPSATYRWTDRDVSVFWEGNRYYPLGFKFDSIGVGSSMSVDEVSLTVDNVERYFSGILLNEDCRNKPVIISFGVRRRIPQEAPLSNIKLSLLDGYAFADLTSVDLTPYLDRRLIVRDSTGKRAIGYIKAAGTGETYGDELITSWTNNGYSTFTASPPDITSAIRTGLIPSELYCRSNTLANVSGMALKLSYDLTLNSGQAPSVKIAYSYSPPPPPVRLNLMAKAAMEAGSHVLYASAGISADFSAQEIYIDNTARTNWEAQISLKQILTPASTGVTIVSAKGGSDQNWETVDEGFDCDDANGYTYEIEGAQQAEEDLVETLFRGMLAGWNIEGDSTVTIKVANEFILWNKKTLRKHAPACPWVFKGVECGYAGSGKTLCDKTYDTCKALGNESRFGGHRWIPVIAEREDWWGRTRG